MRVFAYCCRSFAHSTQRVVGYYPLITCPPILQYDFKYQWLEGHDVIYFDLHGRPGDSQWYGDGNAPALAESQIRKANLSGTVVFALNCFLSDDDSPMMDALLDAGATYVIGGEGKNWADDSIIMHGATKLAQYFIGFMRLSVPPLKALSMAKMRLKVSLATNKLTGKSGFVAKDTLQFRAYYRN
jgi:hypothetical protein